MKIIIHKTILLDALQLASKGVPNKTTLPVLSGLLIEINDDQLTVSGSDTDFMIKTTVSHNDFQSEVVGTVVLPAKETVEVVKKMPNGYIKVEVQSRFVTRFSSGRTHVEIVGMNPEDYPILPPIHTESQVELQGRVFKDLVKRSVFSAAYNYKDSPILNGVLIRSLDGNLCFTATDRHRAAKVMETSDINFPGEVVVLASHLKDIADLIDDTKPVKISYSKSKMIVQSNQTSMYASVLDGTYPPVDQLFKQNVCTEIDVNVLELIEALDRAKLTADSMKFGHIVRFDISRKEILITSRSECGNSEDVVHQEGFNGNELSLSFSAKYLLEALRAIDDATATIRFSGPSGPFLINGKRREDLFVICPYIV